MAIDKNNNIKYNLFLETSANVELNAINIRQHQRSQCYTTSFNKSTTKDDCFFGLCFYCQELDHRALNCPKRPQQQQHHLIKNRPMIDVVGDTCTSTFSFKSSCQSNVFSYLIISSISDVQDVTKSGRHDLTEEIYTINGRVIQKNVSSHTAPLREIISIMTMREFYKSALMF
ncbi:unnamed protein product [Rotaria sordida]|uniref:CCHC-type domain-containing protein n=1 Tax=Rotaria sordida TaxID=392033 RepID=A0A815SLE4_9BILA|nr:unnamed protein product [Rotaria sordida]